MSDLLRKLKVPLLAVMAHLAAFVQFELQKGASPLPSQWEIQFSLAVGVSLLASLALGFTRHQGLIWLWLTLRGGILLLVGIPMGRYLGVEMTLLTALLIEAVAYTKFAEGLIFAAAYLALFLFSQGRLKAWEVQLPAPTAHDLFSLLIYAIFVIALAQSWRPQNHSSLKEMKRLFHEATLRLAETNIQLQDYAALVEQQSAINERKRLSREIHDALGYTFANLVMMLEAALSLVEEGAAELPDHLARTRDQAKEGLLEVRRALQLFRSEQSGPKGLTAVRNLIEAFTKATNIPVELNLGDAPLFLGGEADLAVYRLVQEGLTNAIRHGKASEIYISFYRKDNGVCIYIKDNGIGAGLIEDGFGLKGMRERIERLGGHLAIDTQPGEGFKLNVWIPL